MKRKYKVAFFGMGSIGKRHLNNVIKYFQAKDCGYQIDLVRTQKRDDISFVMQSQITNVYTYSDELDKDYDILFITNPTNEHYNTILKYKDCTKHMFIEKPVFHRLDYDIEKIKPHGQSVYYVACPLRYTKTLKYIKENFNLEEAYAVRAICSSYLPDWRAKCDYRKTYSAQKEMGGGVSLDLIHEWDYLIDLFGKPKRVQCVIGKYSNLEINSDDLAVYIGELEKSVVELHLDYFGRSCMRNLQVFLPDDTIEADIVNGVIKYNRQKSTINVYEDRDDYQYEELTHFFDIINGVALNNNSLLKAIETIKTVKGEY